MAQLRMAARINDDFCCQDELSNPNPQPMLQTSKLFILESQISVSRSTSVLRNKMLSK
jgi:hypothetical protein